MDLAHSGLEGCTDPIYYPVRRPDEQRLTQTPFTQNSGHALPSAVMISSHQCEPNKTSPVQSSTSGSTALMPVGAQAMAIYRQLIDAIATQSEDVGTSFAEEARKIHYNEAPERPIRGEATVDECEALRDEGINVLQLPLLKSEDLN